MFIIGLHADLQKHDVHKLHVPQCISNMPFFSESFLFFKMSLLFIDMRERKGGERETCSLKRLEITCPRLLLSDVALESQGKLAVNLRSAMRVTLAHTSKYICTFILTTRQTQEHIH